MGREDKYTLEGVEIKRPSSFKIERYKVTNANRLANAEMVADVIARKRKFYLTWTHINSEELDKILNTIWENDNYFFTFTYVENGKTQTATVYPGSIPSELYRPEGKWIWKDVTINLIEK